MYKLFTFVLNVLNWKLYLAKIYKERLTPVDSIRFKITGNAIIDSMKCIILFNRCDERPKRKCVTIYGNYKTPFK